MKYTISQLSISRLRWSLSAFILLITSLGFYSFFYLFRESIRYVFSVSRNHEIWLMSDHEVLFYNSFYAFISIIMGTSMAISFLIDRPIGLKRERRIRTSILNDQRVLNWYFLAWATKLSLCLGIFFSLGEGYFEFSLLPTYGYLFVLICICLFLNIWLNIFRFIKVDVLKTLVVSGLVTVLFSIGLGSINLIDYGKLNDVILKDNVYHNYELQKPRANYCKYLQHQFRYVDFFIVHSKDKSDKSEKLFLKETEIDDLREIDSLLKDWEQIYSYSDRLRYFVKLHINSKTKMHVVNDVLYRIAKARIRTIGYSVIPSFEDKNRSRNKHFYIPRKIMDYEVFYDFFPDFENSKKIKEIEIEQFNDSLIFNGKNIKHDEFYDSLEETLLANNEVAFYHSYNKEISYKSFIEIYATIVEVITKVRNQYSIKQYGKEIDYIERSEQKVIRDKYPMIIIDENYKSRFMKG